jgi:hypothetical protein
MTGRLWPVADAQYRRILHANAILQRIKAVEVCGIKTRQANSKDRRRTPENPKGANYVRLLTAWGPLLAICSFHWLCAN